MGTVAFVPVRNALAALLLLGPLLAACGGTEAKVPVPPGFREQRGAGFGFAAPADWRRAEERDDHGRPVTVVRGPELPSAGPDGVVHAQRYADYPQDFATALAQFRDLARLNGYRLTADREARVQGAARAHRFEASYELSSDQGERVSFRLVGMYALTERKSLVEFMLRAPEQGRAVALLPAVLDSFRPGES